ncbi:MAG: hypothetical protein KDJ52_03735 [Anaerolineae bacterium]|nr:hypothetical protein [Anaerolineae bacterium]
MTKKRLFLFLAVLLILGSAICAFLSFPVIDVTFSEAVMVQCREDVTKPPEVREQCVEDTHLALEGFQTIVIIMCVILFIVGIGFGIIGFRSKASKEVQE